MSNRARPRVHLQLVVTFKGDHMSGGGTIANLSISGCEVESATVVRVNAHLCLRIHASHDRKPVIVALAIVRWVKQHRFGVAFIRFDPGAKEAFLLLLQQRGHTAQHLVAK